VELSVLNALVIIRIV